MDQTTNANSAVETPEASEAARRAEIEAAKPSWARKNTPPAAGNGPASNENGSSGTQAPQKAAEAKPDLKNSISNAAAKAEGKPAGAVLPKIEGKAEEKPEVEGEQSKEDPKKPVKVVFPVMGRQIAVEMTKEEADFLDKNPRFKSQIQKSLGAELKFDEAAREKQRTDKIFEMFKDPNQIERALKHFGYDNPRELLEQLLYKHIEIEKMTPEQRRLKETEDELRSIKEQEAERQQAAKAEEHRKATEHWGTEYQKKIINAISKSNLPATEETVGRVAFYMREALEQLNKEVTPEQVLPLVREDYKRSLKKLLMSSDNSVIAELLGEDGLSKVRNYELERIKNEGKKIPGVPPQKGPAREIDQPSNQKPRMTVEEFRERNARIKRGEILIG